MNEVAKTTGVVHFSEFFAPISPDLIASLLKQYGDKLNSIKSVAEYMESPGVSSAVSYFVTADRKKHSDRSHYNLEFDVSAATAVLDSEFWQKALNLTDVYDHMPQDRRSDWSEMIRDCKCVSFESDTVYSTIESLLNSRAQFLAERVDGMFRSLSGEHVTNSPSGFNKRMIIAGAIDHLDLVSCI
jgi:Glu-tRNA(Gln) amidotransferase subunit E-like FAD-binding protein